MNSDVYVYWRVDFVCELRNSPSGNIASASSSGEDRQLTVYEKAWAETNEVRDAFKWVVDFLIEKTKLGGCERGASRAILIGL